MKFSWDRDKARQNKIKHGVAFEAACRVFDDPLAVSILDTRYREDRWITVGVVGSRVLIVAHTYPASREEAGKVAEEIRIVSAREATPRERQEYEEG
jgi:uncharacterized protein